MAINLSEYKNISRIIFWSFGINIFCILLLNFSNLNNAIFDSFGVIMTEAILQFFFGAIGATIACSIFMKKDKEINELEALKATPDPKELRLPDSIDKRLYIQRIITSGFLAILGMFILLLAFNYLEVDYEKGFTFKQKLLIGVFSCLIGLNQAKFLTNLERYFDSFLKTKTTAKKP